VPRTVTEDKEASGPVHKYPVQEWLLCDKMHTEQEKQPSEKYLHLKRNTAHDKRVCKFKMSVLMKLERALEDNLCNLIAVLMSLCDSDIKIQ